MFVTHGPIPPESGLFVGRAAELKRLENWLVHVNCVGAVLGARQTGKTSLLLQLRHLCRNKYAFVFVNLQGIDGAQSQECFNYIAEQMMEQLSGILEDADLTLPKDTRSFPAFLREFSKKSSAVRIVIILDEIGALRPETGIKLASTIRAVFTDRVIKPEFARYIFLLAGATDMLELATGKNSPLANVTERIYLGDLSLSETEQLLSHTSERKPFEELAVLSSHLHEWTNGHPYWTQLLAATLEERPKTHTKESVRETVQNLLRTEDINLPHVIRSVQADKILWAFVESLLDDLPLPFSRTSGTIARLELIGILRDQEGRCKIRNRIYQEAIHKHQVRPARSLAKHLRALSAIVHNASSPDALLREVSAFVQQVLQSRNVVLLARRHQDRRYRIFHSLGIASTLINNFEIEADGPLAGQLEAGVELLESDLTEPDRAKLRRIGSELLQPLQCSGPHRYFMSLGQKLSGEAYDAGDRSFLSLLAERVGEAIARFSHLVLEQDAEAAHEVQLNLMPKEIPQISGMEICGLWQPARVVGGDYYDVLKISEHKTALCIADVVGKGMPAALWMSNLQAKVKALANERTTPETMCAELNRMTLSDMTSGKLITFFYALIDGQTRRMTYANAGHCPPILLHADGTTERLGAEGAILGFFPDWNYSQAQVELLPGDRLVLYTDGVTEAQDAHGNDFGEERLSQLLKDHRQSGAGELRGEILNALADFSNGERCDDVTFIVLAVDKAATSGSVAI